MIQDFEDCDDGATFEADLCIVGAGAIGISLALEFLHGPHRVLLLEGGGRHHEAASQRLALSDVVGLPHGSVNDGRARVLGGTTTLWAGQASPLDRSDFRARPWVPHSGWSLSHADVAPYFRRAESIMHLPAITYDEASWGPRAAPPPAFDPALLRTVIAQFSPRPDFGRAYRTALRRSERVRVLLHANVTYVTANAGATAVDHLELRSVGGRRGKARAKRYVICGGAIEAARLLLASTNVERDGLGNRYDMVGRYFQEHIHCRAARIEPVDRRRLRRMYGPYYVGRIKRQPKIAAGEALQARERILNVAGEIITEIAEDSAVEAAKLLVRAPRRRDLWTRIPRAVGHIARRPHEPAWAALRYFAFRHAAALGRGPIYLGVQAEQTPNPESRVRLTNDRDALGMPRVALDWRLTALDRRTIEVYVRTVAQEFARLGLGTVDLDTLDVSALPGALNPFTRDGNHHIGTTRMADDPKRGVVDRDCKVHGIANLYICGAGVFPTGGFSNPTFNAIALALRVADRLKRAP